ncbi:MAG: flavin reductase family protein [candidate division WOR-3 bacterium]|mgnify:CR=1 FL=1|jgi:flavin reductase (DIM6/NTAB) family NADH-FMN oxidoreductase RutF
MREKFKEFMRNVPQAVFIAIGKSTDNKLAGLTISSFESISLKPLITLISIDKNAESLNVFLKAIGWTISLLNEEQEEISKFFSNKDISQAERFKLEYPKSASLKIPYIENAIGYIECIYYRHLEMGDHIIFFGKVVNVQMLNDKKPLIYYHRSYRKIM